MSDIYGGLQYRLHGQPVLPDLNLVELEYWVNWQPYTLIWWAPPPPGNKTYAYYDSASNTFKLVVDNVDIIDLTKDKISLLKEVEITGSLTLPYIEKTANYTLTASDYTVNCITNTFTITLPTAVGITGRIYNIKNSGTGIITVDGNWTETIDGELTQTLYETDSICIQSTGTNWIII